jgi:biotin carboxylase
MPARPTVNSQVPDHRGVPHLLLVGARPEVVGKLVGLPLALTVALRPDTSGECERAVALRTVDVDITDPMALLAAARQVNAWRRIDAILGLSELAVHSASAVGAALGVRANPPAPVAAAQDKSIMRKWLADCGLDSVHYRVCRRLADAERFMRECPEGMILKPVEGNGGTGVYLVCQPAELAAAWEFSTTASGEWCSPGLGGRVVLAEQYLAGQEFSVETISAGGEHRVLAVTVKHNTGPPHFVEIGHDLPAPLLGRDYAIVTNAVCAALDAIGQMWGPCHTEVMLLADRAVVVEVNSRLSGDRIWEMVELATGVSMAAAAVSALAFGELPVLPRVARGAAAIRFLTARPGRVISITGVDDALATDGVIRVGELCSVGTVVRPLADSWTRLGYVLAAGPDLGSAVHAAELAASRIDMKTAPGDDQRDGAG